MKLTLLRNEKNLTALVGRLYQIKGRNAREISSRAEEALLKANPQLGKIGDLAEGTPLVVPEVAGAQILTPLSHSEYLGEATIEQVRSGLTNAIGLIESSLKVIDAEAKNTIETLKSPEVRKILRADPAINELTIGIINHAKSDMEEVQAGRKAIKQAVSSLSKDLEEFGTIFRR